MNGIVNDDVARARALLTSTLQQALLAAKEHSTVVTALAAVEGNAWHEQAEALLPRFDAQSLHNAAVAINEPRLPELLRARDEAIEAARGRRDELQDAVLDQAEFEAMSKQRSAVDVRVAELRTRLRELRAKRAPQQQQNEMQAALTTLESEAVRLATVTARHHRAKRDLTNAVEDTDAIADRYLSDARAVVASKLATMPEQAGASAVKVRAAQAKRAILTVLFEHWLRPHGATLMALDQRPAQLTGFDTVTFPSQVELACREAHTALTAYRAAFDAAAVATDDVAHWWQALVPGVPQPSDETFTALGVAPPPVAAPVAPQSVADVAQDKLSAAWASMRGEDAPPPSSSSSSSGVGNSGFLTEATFTDATDVLVALPRVPTLLHAQNKISEAALSSQEYAAIFDEPSANFDGRDVFTASPTSSFMIPDKVRPVDVGELVRKSFAVGSKVGRCTVLGLVGKGGMGELYRARLEGEHGFSRAVVLKRISIERDADPTILTSFVREAEVAARVSHPNVVQMFDLLTHDGEPYMLMELLEGLSTNKLASRAWRAGEVLGADIVARIAKDAARGLFAAHSMRADDGSLAGLVHRDVSPDNLFLCSNGFTKLLDFGIARRADATTMTGKNELKGKIPYMSPEQITGEPLDGRSDLFSLGSSLYWLLTGERPFVGDNEVTTLYAVVNKAHRPLRELRPDAGPLVEVVEQLLSKSKDDRPSSALDVVKRLEACSPASPEQAGAFLQLIEAL